MVNKSTSQFDSANEIKQNDLVMISQKQSNGSYLSKKVTGDKLVKDVFTLWKDDNTSVQTYLQDNKVDTLPSSIYNTIMQDLTLNPPFDDEMYLSNQPIFILADNWISLDQQRTLLDFLNHYGLYGSYEDWVQSISNDINEINFAADTYGIKGEPRISTETFWISVNSIFYPLGEDEDEEPSPLLAALLPPFQIYFEYQKKHKMVVQQGVLEPEEVGIFMSGFFDIRKKGFYGVPNGYIQMDLRLDIDQNDGVSLLPFDGMEEGDRLYVQPDFPLGILWDSLPTSQTLVILSLLASMDRIIPIDTCVFEIGAGHWSVRDDSFGNVVDSRGSRVFFPAPSLTALSTEWADGFISPNTSGIYDVRLVEDKVTNTTLSVRNLSDQDRVLHLTGGTVPNPQNLPTNAVWNGTTLSITLAPYQG